MTSISRAAVSTTRTIDFQGKLLDSNNEFVPNGSYNMEFKIYQGGNGTQAGNPGGTLVWSEAHINDNAPDGGVEVKNGSFAVRLGSVIPFNASVDWDHPDLWLSINIAGSSVSCTAFGSVPCVDDGEMLPMKRMTAIPYAISAGAVGGKTINDIVQLGQGIQADNSTGSSIFINKTNSGNLVQLQNTNVDIFTVTNSGSIVLGSGSNHSISISTPSEADIAGRQLTITAGNGGSGAGTAGGDVVIAAGNGGGTDGSGGDIEIDAGAKTGSGTDGSILIGTKHASSIVIGSGNTSITISGGSETAYLGNGITSATPSNFLLQGTNSSTSDISGGSLVIQGGNGTVGSSNGGNLTLGGGSGSGGGAAGLVVINTPTFNTASTQLCDEDCVVTQSNIDSNGVISLNATEPDLTITMNNPTITTAGRIMYVTATDASYAFTLSLNNDARQLMVRAGNTVSLLWNGTSWTVTNAGSSSEQVTDSTSHLQVGSGSDEDELTLLTVDKAASAPTITDQALLGSMYYDTTLDRLQCYEASGWGACAASPDTFISLSPEYANAVTHGSDEGELSSGICSDTLGINNALSPQQICGTNETYNFYNWTSSEATAQSKSIYVTYQLPTNFKSFIGNSTSLMARTDDSGASVTYQLYRNTTSGLVACGSEITASTGLQSTWKKSTASGAADPANCSFAPGNSLVVKITLTASGGANAYVSNLNFAFSNN